MGEDFWSAKSIANRYEFIKELGSGATGTVNLALDKTLDKQVAIKILKVNWTANQLVRFQQEARLSGKLKHSNIATVMDFGVTDGGQPYLIMEYVDGGSLASLIAEERTLPLSTLLKLFIDICRGMEHSHGQGILHRDLKPENVIVETDENGALHAKIVDFGLAKMQDTDASITRTGAFLGSPLYAAPEQSQGTFDARSDIYSMGCLMYHVIKGRPPFSGDTSLETSILHKTAAIPRLNEGSNEQFPSLLEETVLKCLMKRKEDRYQNFNDLQTDLEKVSALYRDELEGKSGKSGGHEAVAEALSTRKQRLGAIIWVGALLALLAVPIILFVGKPSEDLSKYAAKEKPKQKPKRIALKMKERQSEKGLEVYVMSSEIDDSELKKLNNYTLINSLILKRTHVTGVGFKDLPGLSIEELYLDGCPVTFAGLKTIMQIPGLRTLSLRAVNEIDADWLRYLAGCRHLTQLSVSSPQLSKDPVKSLKELCANKSLVVLQIGNMHVSHQLIQELMQMKSLHGLQLRSCQIDPDGWKSLQKWPGLVSLTFMNMELNADEMQKIVKIPVRELNFSDVNISAAALNLLKGDRKVRELKVCCKNISEVDKQRISDSIPWCKSKVINDGAFNLVDPETFSSVEFSLPED